MNIKCPSCGNLCAGTAVFCNNCGTRLASPSSPGPKSQQQQIAQMAAPHASSGQQKSAISQAAAAAQPPAQVSAVQQPPVQQSCVQPAPQQPAVPQKKAKKKKKHGFLKFLMWIAIIAAFLALLWFSFGNILTLYLHSEDVVATVNSGSLELPGLGSDRDELPDFVQEMLGQGEPSGNPVIDANLPYLQIRRENIHGFFGDARVEYVITAPDVEGYLMELDMTTVTSSQQLLDMVLEYIPRAPFKEFHVTVQYHKDGFFSIDWRGNYMTPEFSDAVSGGLNSAYNRIYQQMMDELKEAMS